MEPQILLRDPDIFPSNEVLQNILEEPIYDILLSFLETVRNEEYSLTVEW